MRRGPLAGLALSLAATAGCDPCDGARVLVAAEGGLRKLDVCAEVARTEDELRAGLAGRDSLPGGTGLLLEFPVTGEVCITGEGMRFPIDVIFVSGAEAAAVAHVHTLDEDDPLLVCVDDVRLVLEVNAGEADRVTAGDSVSVEWPPGD